MREEERKDRRYDLKMAISHLENAVNNFSYGEQTGDCINQLSRQHRALQQNVWRMVAIKGIYRY